MTRESRPRFDRYAELLVSTLASAAIIGAAYRFLVRRHDRDAVNSTNAGASIDLTPLTPGAVEAEPAAVAPVVIPTPRATAGVNAAEVNRFLADLRTLDHRRAVQVWDGRGMAHAKGYTRAHGAAMAAAAQADRQVEWEFAQDAASLIARAILGDSPITEPVVEVVADLAGAIAIGDLIPSDDMDILLLPWTWQGEPITEREPWAQPLWSRAHPAASTLDSPEPGLAEEATVAEEARVAAAMATAAAASLDSADASSTRAIELPAPPRSIPAAASASGLESVRAAARRRARSTSQPVIFAILGLVVLVGAVLALNGPRREQAAAARTDAPSLVLSPSAAAIAPPSPAPIPTIFVTLPVPTLTPAPTPAPTTATAPTVRPAPRPTPKPTPKPTPTPTLYCKVPNLVGLETNRAKGTWSSAGFTGQVTFSPAIPPHYTITSQSRTAGSSIRCTSGLTVSGTP